MFTLCEESHSRMVLISRARGIECAATAVPSSPGMSVQPDIPIFVSALPLSSAKARRRHAAGQRSACSFPMSGRGCRVATRARTGTPSGTSVQPDARRFRPFAFLPRLQRRDGTRQEENSENVRFLEENMKFLEPHIFSSLLWETVRDRQTFSFLSCGRWYTRGRELEVKNLTF